MNVLVVDDVPANRTSLRAALEPAGHHVIEAGDGREALALLEKQPVDIIVTDILMPRMDGYRLCREVRHSKEFAEIPLIIYTSTYTASIDEQAALELGADLFLRKPLPPGQMLDALNKVSGLASRRRQSQPADEVDLMQEYNQRLVDKLAKKSEELEAQAISLRKSEERLHIVIENLTEGLVISDLGGQLINWNPAALKMHGFQSEEECLRQIADFATIFELSTHDGRVLPVDQWPLARIIGGETVRSEDLRIRRKDRNWRRIFRYGGTTVQGSEGTRLAFVSITDITSQKQAEEEIKNQLYELRRWRNVTLGREERIQALKREVNELLARAGQPLRYESEAGERTGLN